MASFERFGLDPLQGLTRPLSNPRPDLLDTIAYQTGTSDQGLFMVQLTMTFRPRGGATNPEMSLALLVDSSGSMQDAEAYSEIEAIFSHVREGSDPVFFDDEPSFAGPMRPHLFGQNEDLMHAVAAHDRSRRDTDDRAYVRQLVDTLDLHEDKDRLARAPRSTSFTAALQATIQHYHTRRGLYILVFTDGQFEDRDEILAYVATTLLPQFTPDNPYAFRLHFVTLGNNVDHAFLEQLEALAQQPARIAAGHDIQLITHHHVHLGHSYDDIVRDLDRSFVGIAGNVTVGESNAGEGASMLLRVGNLNSGRWFDGPLCDIGFVPLRAQIGLELISPHPPSLDLVIRYTDPYGTNQEIPLQVSLPSITATDCPATPVT